MTPFHTAKGLISKIITVAAFSGTLYIGDDGNNNVRQVDPTGILPTLAGAGVSGLGLG